jgi:transcriptional regulator with XRE-family HTH domain
MTRRALTPEELDDAQRLRQIWNEKKEELHLSQVKVAQEMGFSSQAAVSQYLNARLPLNMAAVAKFAQVLRSKVEDISPRYARMVGDPIPSELEGYIAPQTGSIGGVPTDDCLDWFAFSSAFLEVMGATSLKLFRIRDDSSKEFPAGTVLLVDETQVGEATDGVYVLHQADGIVVRRLTVSGNEIIVHGKKEMRISKDAFGFMKVLARVVAICQKA